MKFRTIGRTFLALAGAVGIAMSLTSCNDSTVAYTYVIGTQYGQISELRQDYNNGTLYPIDGSPIGSGGANPLRMVVPAGDRFVYVLNAGTPSTDSSGSVTYASSNISIFSVGGYGNLSPQLQYSSQGFGSQRIAVDSSGTHLFVLDEYAPVGITAGGTTSPTAIATAGNASYPCLGTDGLYHPTGDITVFNIDTATGRLELVQNNRQLNLSYFPVGCFPIDFHLTASYMYTMDAGSTSTNDVQTVNVQAVSNGQLTPTQTSSIQVTAGNTSDITAITGDNGSKYVYLIDTSHDLLYLYTVGSSGALTAITGSPYNNGPNTQAGGPVQTVVDSTGKYLYVANGGPAGGVGNANADVSVYNIDQTTGYLDTPVQSSPFPLGSGTVSGPVCILEDPTNQFIYVAGALDNSITGRKLDPNTGTLKPLNAASTFPTVGTPSWCVTISAAF